MTFNYKMKDNKMWLLISAGILVLTFNTAYGCPSGCHCTGFFVNCKNTALREIPKNLDFYVQKLDLSHNYITKISRNDFSNYKFLNNLTLAGNVIEIVDDLSFDMLSNLQHLDLSGNKISAVTSDTLGKHLNKLQIFLMNNNNLNALPHNFFDSRMTDLRKIDLSRNKLVSLADNSFSHLEKLTELDLSHNKLNNVGQTMFNSFPNLKNLSLSYNEFVAIPTKNFYPLKNLISLKLDHNQIYKVADDAFKDLNETVFLSLAWNKLREIPDKAWDEMKNLHEMDYSGNPVRQLTKDSFISHHVESILRLNVSNMPELESIGKFAFFTMTKLQRLDLNNCPQLKYINNMAFKPREHLTILKDLKYFQMRGSGFTTLEEDLLDWDNMTSVDIRDNAWRCDCHLRWMIKYKFVKKWNLRCASPEEFKGRFISALSPEELNCSKANVSIVNTLRIILIVSAVVVTLVISVLLYNRYKKRIPCLYKSPGKYVSLYNISDKNVQDGGNVVVRYRDDEVGNGSADQTSSMLHI